MSRTRTVRLYDLAHSRSGDKGNCSNLSVIALRTEYFPILQRVLTADIVASRFAHRHPSKVTRYELPKIGAFNFVLDDLLEGGVNAALGLDGHGKALSFHLLGLQLELDGESATVLDALSSPAEAAHADATVKETANVR